VREVSRVALKTTLRSELSDLFASLRGAKRRSNPGCLRGKILDCFAALAMAKEAAERQWPAATSAYSSLPRVIAIEASVLVRLHSMLSRR